ncbi:MAG: hypothetical protein K0S74_1610 [Chlamydiales bacterium]|jgi:hypothetical protein|nr:hypothetical protein [Chlamydiales bacterium]
MNILRVGTTACSKIGINTAFHMLSARKADYYPIFARVHLQTSLLPSNNHNLLKGVERRSYSNSSSFKQLFEDNFFEKDLRDQMKQEIERCRDYYTKSIFYRLFRSREQMKEALSRDIQGILDSKSVNSEREKCKEYSSAKSSSSKLF